MTDLPDPNRPQTPPPSAPGIPPAWSGASEPSGSYPPYPLPVPPTDLTPTETLPPPPPRRGPFGLGWPWWIAGGCAVLLLCCLCSLLLLTLVTVANGRSTLPTSPVPGPAPRVTPAPTAPPRPSFSDDAPSEPAPAAAPQQGNSASPTGTAALDFELSTLDGQKVRLSDFRGRPVIINFWATWCGPCLAEMPLLKKTYDDLKDSGLVLLAVDVQEKPDTVRKFAEKEQLPFTVLLDETGLVATYYRVTAYPTTFFVDANGVVQSWQRGTLTKTTLDRHLDRIR